MEASCPGKVCAPRPLNDRSRSSELEIIVETRTAVATDAAAQLANHAAYLIKSKVGVTAKVRAVVPGSIERSQGKAKRVLDKRSRL